MEQTAYFYSPKIEQTAKIMAINTKDFILRLIFDAKCDILKLRKRFRIRSEPIGS